MAGAPLGNRNAANGRKFADKLRVVLAADDYARLRAIAEEAVKQAEAGEPWAIQFVADRLDGKPAQTIAGDAENPLQLVSRIERAIVRPAD